MRTKKHARIFGDPSNFGTINGPADLMIFRSFQNILHLAKHAVYKLPRPSEINNQTFPPAQIIPKHESIRNRINRITYNLSIC